MKHVIYGGDGFVGRYLARDLLKLGEHVVVCDINKTDLPIYDRVEHRKMDVIDARQVADLPLDKDDIVYNMAAHLLLPIMPRKVRYEHFHGVIVEGTRNILDNMRKHGVTKLVQFSTDMVYGVPDATPVPPDAPRAAPMGPYAETKQICEDLCLEARKEGIDSTIFRPRMIVGPGRLGLLESLFKLIDANLPVPLIGSGKNRYQMISVFDCADAALRAAQQGCPHGEHNLGSDNPPIVWDLLNDLIKEAGSRSFLLPTPAMPMRWVLNGLDMLGMPLLVPEQFHVAHLDYVVDNTSTKETFGWAPRYNDNEMIKAAYHEYRQRKREGVITEMVMET